MPSIANHRKKRKLKKINSPKTKNSNIASSEEKSNKEKIFSYFSQAILTIMVVIHAKTHRLVKIMVTVMHNRQFSLSEVEKF